MRLVVTGGRDYTNLEKIWDALDAFEERHGPIETMICGGAIGVDLICETWARERGKKIDLMKPEWSKWGKAAGMIRNEAMILQGKPDRALAFPGGRGTAHMVSMLEKHNVPYEMIMV